MFLENKNIFEDLLRDFVFTAMHFIALLLFPLTALRSLIDIIGDRDQKTYYWSEFPVMVLKSNFASVLNCLRRRYKKTVAESCDNIQCVFTQ